MNTTNYFYCFLLLIILSCQNSTSTRTNEDLNQDNEVTFFTPDSIKIYGDLYNLDKSASTILLFHQGGSNARAEYVSIIPRLIEKGYNVFAIDQRVGGQVYGGYNRTLVDILDNSFDNPYGYCDAYNNLESALDYIINAGFSGKKILWGSSYSASLAIQLASKRQADISGVLAFSPASGGSMQACLPDPYFKSLSKPLFVLRPQSEMESEKSKDQFALVEKEGHRTYVPDYGKHGSSMLVEERVGHNVEPTWTEVFSFLSDIENN